MSSRGPPDVFGGLWMWTDGNVYRWNFRIAIHKHIDCMLILSSNQTRLSQEMTWWFWKFEEKTELSLNDPGSEDFQTISSSKSSWGWEVFKICRKITLEVMSRSTRQRPNSIALTFIFIASPQSCTGLVPKTSTRCPHGSHGSNQKEYFHRCQCQ